MLNRILTALFTGSSKGQVRNVQLQRQIEELQAQQLKLSDRLEELQSEHRKLRGRFYAARGELEAVPQTRDARKAQALAAIGYRPGQPAPHRE